MDVSAGNVIAIVLPLFAVAATWGGLLWRIGRVEKDLEHVVSKVDAKLGEFQLARERQGERIGALEYETARLSERSGMPATVEVAGRRRRLTKPQGEG